MEIKLIPKNQLDQILPLVMELNPTVAPEILLQRINDLKTQQYLCAGAYINDELIGICGLWFTTRLYCGKQIELDNVVVKNEYRSQGIGKQLMAWVFQLAKDNGIGSIELNSYIDNTASHRFYDNQGFSRIGYRFQKLLNTSSAEINIATLTPEPASRIH